MKENGIGISALKISILLFGVKLLGLVKQVLIMSICGATYETDVYFVATGVLFSICTIIISAFTTPLLALHTDCLVKNGREASNALINAAIKIAFPITAVITCFLLFFPRPVAKALAPAYEGERFELLCHAIQIVSVIFVFCGVQYVLNVVLETEKRFLPGRFFGLFHNFFVSAAVLFLYPKFGISSLLYAFVCAVVIQCVQIAWNTRNLFSFSRKSVMGKEDMRGLLYMMVPLLVGNAIYEINDIVDKQIASGLGEGSISHLTSGASINEMVTTLVISAVSSVLFVHFSTWIAQGNHQKVGEQLKTSVESLIVILIPVMVVCLICGEDIVTILYGRGSFDGIAIENTTKVVMGYALGFCAQAIRANFVRVYYAFQNTKTPMINGAISILLNISLSLILSRFLGVGGIAVATSVSIMFASLLMLPGIKKLIPGFNLKRVVTEGAKALGMTLVLLPVGYFFRAALSLNVYFRFTLTGTFILLSYVAGGYLLNIRVIRTFPQIFQKRGETLDSNEKGNS